MKCVGEGSDGRTAQDMFSYLKAFLKDLQPVESKLRELKLQQHATSGATIANSSDVFVVIAEVVSETPKPRVFQGTVVVAEVVE